MSASESESSTTSKEDNSEMYNREFYLEDEHSSEEAKTLGNSNVEAYQDEPLADQDWLDNYARETEQDRLQQQENMRRMQGETPLDVWYVFT